MGLKDVLNLNFKGIILGKGKSKEQAKNPSWMKPICHGYHVVDDEGCWSSDDDSADPDFVFAQREQTNGDSELWFFGVFDPRMGDKVVKYLRSNLFGIKSNEWKITKKIKGTVKKAFANAQSKMMEEEDDDEICRVGSASVLVINRERLVIANLADYKAIVCKNGEARQIGSKNLSKLSSHFNILSTKYCRFVASDPEVAVGTKKIHSDTEFVIIASNGIWEVMKSQEAVSLIRHIKDPQAAARILTREAMNRMTKNKISCLVIRFN